MTKYKIAIEKRMDKNNLIVNATKISTKSPAAPAWFTFWVKNEFRPLKADVASLKKDVTTIKTRFDNIVKLNNLKE